MSQAQGGSKPTPVRRSTRLGSASVAGTQVESVATTSLTPSRAAARRKGALPKVKPRESFAYGASGRVGAVEQLSVPVTGFAQAFEAQRNQAVARDIARDEEDESEHGSIDHLLDELAGEGSRPPVRTGRSQPSIAPKDRSYQSSAAARSIATSGPSRTARNAVPSRSLSPEIDETGSMTPSIMDTSKSFGMEREAGMTSAYASRTNGTTRRAIDITTRRPPPPPIFQANATQTTQLRTQVLRPQRPQPESSPIRARVNGRIIPARKINGNVPLRQNRDDDEDDEDEEEGWLQRFQGWYRNISINVDWRPYTRMGLYALAAFLFLLLVTSPAGRSAKDAAVSRAGNAYGTAHAWINRPARTPSVARPAETSTTPKLDVVDREGRKVGQPGYKTFIDRLFSLEDKAGALEDHYADLEGQSTALDRSLRNLQQHLPPFLIVSRHKDNSLEIHDEFWRALISKMKSEGLSGPDNSADVDWNTFLAKNREKILRIMSDELKNTSVKDSFRIVARDEFVTLMRQEYTKLSNLVDKRVEEAVKSTSKKMAKDIASKSFHDEIRIQSLAMANLVANAELSLRKVNYFSLGLGARIDPFKTSSTMLVQDQDAFFLKRWLTPSRMRPPPIAALEKWDEPGECWCAAPDEQNRGLAQLTILLGHEMLPRQITVEHLPKAASLDYTVAPKSIEIWAESDEKNAAARNCGEVPEGYICLGRFSFNIHGDNHIQTFDLDAIVTQPISKTVVRVMDNWGSDHTCLYRLRLHGEPAPVAVPV